MGLSNNPVGLVEILDGVIKYRQVEIPTQGPFDDRKTTCKLSICENGRTITIYTCIGYALPSQMAIDFSYLTLSQDRNSLDLSSPHFCNQIKSIIDLLLCHKELNPLMRSSLLNALYPLVAEPNINLISYIQQKIQDRNLMCIPAIREFVISLDPESYYFRPEFISFLKCKPIPYLSHPRTFLIQQRNPIHVIGCAKIHEENYIFVDSSVISTQRAITFLNLGLIKDYVHEKTVLDPKKREEI